MSRYSDNRPSTSRATNVVEKLQLLATESMDIPSNFDTLKNYSRNNGRENSADRFPRRRRVGRGRRRRRRRIRKRPGRKRPGRKRRRDRRRGLDIGTDRNWGSTERDQYRDRERGRDRSRDRTLRRERDGRERSRDRTMRRERDRDRDNLDRTGRRGKGRSRSKSMDSVDRSRSGSRDRNQSGSRVTSRHNRERNRGHHNRSRERSKDRIGGRPRDQQDERDRDRSRRSRSPVRHRDPDKQRDRRGDSIDGYDKNQESSRERGRGKQYDRNWEETEKKDRYNRETNSNHSSDEDSWKSMGWGTSSDLSSDEEWESSMSSSEGSVDRNWDKRQSIKSGERGRDGNLDDRKRCLTDKDDRDPKRRRYSRERSFERQVVGNAQTSGIASRLQKMSSTSEKLPYSESNTNRNNPPNSGVDRHVSADDHKYDNRRDQIESWQTDSHQSSRVSMRTIEPPTHAMIDNVKKQFDVLVRRIKQLQKEARGKRDIGPVPIIYDACNKTKMSIFTDTTPRSNGFNCDVFVDGYLLGQDEAPNKKLAKIRAFEAIFRRAYSDEPFITDAVLQRPRREPDANVDMRQVSSNEPQIPVKPINWKQFYILEPEEKSQGVNAACILRQSAEFSKVAYRVEYKSMGRGSMRYCRITLGSDGVFDGHGSDNAKAKNAASEQALREVRGKCWTIMYHRGADTDDPGLTRKQFNESSSDKDKAIPESNIGSKLLKKMGWTGGGIGAEGNKGIEEPIKEANIMMNREGLGLMAESGLDTFVPKIQKYLEDYICSNDPRDLFCGRGFNREERIQIHQIAYKLGLKTNTLGKTCGFNLVISRKRTHVQLFNHIYESGGQTSKYRLVAPIGPSSRQASHSRDRCY